MHEELLNDLGNAQCSMIIDESTNITTKKQLSIVVRYFSMQLMRIICKFLESGTAESILDATTAFLARNGLKLKNCIG